MIAGKDKVVDNKGALQFYNKSATPADKKTIKQFPSSFHEIHKEGTIKPLYYETIYKYVNKTL